MRTLSRFVSTTAVGALLAAGLTLPATSPSSAADESSSSSSESSDDNTPLTVGKYNEITNKRDEDAKDNAAKQKAATQNAAAGYAAGEGLLTLAQKATAGSSNRAVQIVSITLGNVVKGLQAGSKGGAVAGVVTFGFDELMSLLFPPGESTAQMIEQLSVEMTTDFQDVQESLAELNANLSSVGNEVKESAGFAAGSACEVALTSADNKVDHLTTYLDNYNNVFSPTWWDSNVASASSPQDAQKAIYNEVFTTGLSPDDLQNTIDELVQGLYSSGLGQNNSLVSLCADELAANAISGLSGSTDEIVPVGYIEYQVFPALQKLVAGYSSYASVGQTVAATMVQVAQGMNTAAGSVPQSCLDTPQATACARLNADISNTQQGVAKAFMLAGASWRQITNGALGSDLRSDSTSGVTGGDAAWVMDIASYGTPGFFAPGTSALTSTSAASGPASGTTALRDDSWSGLTFTPATSAMWNSILRTQYQKLPNGNNAFPGDTSNSDCLPQQSSSQGSPSNECESANSTGTLMAAAGLNNGSQDVGDNLIIYTGETDSWSLTNGAWYFGVPLQWAGDKFPSDLPIGSVSALSFLDSSMTPNNGASVVVHDPSDYQGNLTTSSVFPFVLYNQVGQYHGAYNTTWELTDNFDNSASGTYFAQVACQTGTAASGAGKWYQGVSFPESAWTINRYTLGNDLYCGAYKYTPPSSPASQSLPRTANSDFYESPTLNLTGYDVFQDFSDDQASLNLKNGVYYCDGTFGNYASKYLKDGKCPELWSSAPGYFTGTSGQGSFTTQDQYLWPVVALPDPTTLSPLGSNAKWLLPTQGSTGSVGLPAVDRQLFQDFLAVNSSISTGPVTAQIPEGVKLQGEPDQASVLLTNAASKATAVQVQFDITNGSFTGAPFSPSIKGDPYATASGVVCTETIPGSAYSCSMTLPPNAVTLVQLPVKLSGPVSNGFTTGTLAVLGNGGSVSQALGGTAQGSFGGVYKLDTDLSQFDQAMLAEVASTDYGSVYDLRATLVDTPQNQIGKVQDTTGLEASPYGVKLLGGYKPGSASGVSDVQFKVQGTLDSGEAKSSVTQSPACAGPGCFTVTGTVGAVSNGTADVNLTIQSGDPRPSTISVRAANDSSKYYASTNPTQVATGDIAKLKISDLPVGVHELTVWGTSVKSNFTVRVVPPNNSVAFTYVSPTTSPTIYLPEAGQWEFTMTPVVTIEQEVDSPSLSSVSINGKLTNNKRNSNDDWLATVKIIGDSTVRHTFWLKGQLDLSNVEDPASWGSGRPKWSGSYTLPNGRVYSFTPPTPVKSGGNGGYTSSVYFDLSVDEDLRYGLIVNPVTKDGQRFELDSDAVVSVKDTTMEPNAVDGTFSGDPITVTVGPSKATAPAGLIATTDPTTGAITLSWQPVVVVPEVTSYVLTATPPDGGLPLRKSVPADVTETTVTPDALGEWTVTLAAVSELGKSPAATETVRVTSAVPPKPDMVDITISPVGVVSGSWMSVASKPQVTGYHIGLYDPAGARVFEDDITVTPRADQGIMRLPEFFGLGKDSQPGEWTFTVAAVNDDGRGLSRRGSLLITQAAIDRMERLYQQEKFLLAAETVELLALDRLECEQGLISGAMPTGSCDGGLFTPSPAYLGVLDDPGTSVVAQYCTGTATSKALANCTVAEGAVVGGTVELLLTQSTLAAGGSAVLKVWESGKTVIWTSPAPVAQGATVLASFPAPSATTPYAVTVGDASPSTGITTVVEVSVPSGSGSDAGSSGATPAAAGPAPANDVVVSSCSSAPCPTITGTRSGSTIVLTLTTSSGGNGLSIFDTSTGAVVFDDASMRVPVGQPVSVTLGGLRTGTNSMRMTVGSQRTSFAIR